MLAAAGGSLITGLLIFNLRGQVPIVDAEHEQHRKNEQKKPRYVYASKEDLGKVIRCDIVSRLTSY